MPHHPLSNRQLRVGEQVKHALAEVLQRNDFLLPAHGGFISVAEVRMSADLKIATAYMCLLNAKDKEETIADLNKKTKQIRHLLIPALRHMKYMPEFRFRLDTSFDNFSKIDALLKDPEIQKDLEEEPSSIDQ